jgi:predicted SnoaL-like aldol condensation-catalyzing enzyme
MTGDPAGVVGDYWRRVWNEGDVEAIDELLADPYIRHSAGGSVVRDRKQVSEDVARYFEALADATATIDDQTTSGDTVWTRLTLRGLNVETEEAVVLSWLHVARVADGRIAEAWHLNAPVDWTKAPDRTD